MKKTLFFSIFFFCLFLFALQTISADPDGWSNESLVTSDTARGDSISVATDQQGNVHITWTDLRNPYLSIYYKKLNNNGAPLTQDIRVSTGTNHAYVGDIATDVQGNVHVVWSELDTLYYKKLSNGGGSLTNALNITPLFSVNNNRIAVATDQQGNVHVIWYNYVSSASNGIYYKKLSNTGAPLTPDILVASPSYAPTPNIAVDPQGNVHIIWESSLLFPLTDIYYAKLNNNGNSLLSPRRIFSGPGGAFHPTVAADQQGNAHLAWIAERNINQNYLVYYTQLNSLGNNVTPEMTLTFGGRAYYPHIAIDSQNNVNFVWMGDAGGYGLHYEKLNKTNGIIIPNTRITSSPTRPQENNFALDRNDNVHAVWLDSRLHFGFPMNVYYKRSIDPPQRYPVLLVHGIYSDDSIWGSVESSLRDEGFEVYRVGQVNGRQGLVPNNQPIEVSALDVEIALQNVKRITGKQRVDIIAHSMGALAARWYIHSPFYKGDIHKLVMLGVPNEGAPIAANISVSGLPFINNVLFYVIGQVQGNDFNDTARKEMIPNSPFLQSLNTNYAERGVNHITIAGSRLTSIPILKLPICIVQPDYCTSIYYSGHITTDSIVPVSSANFIGICYQAHLTHASPLGPTYYDQSSTQHIINILQDQQQIGLPSCQEQLEGTTSADSNSVQVFRLNNQIAAGQTQTVLDELWTGYTFMATIAGSSGSLSLELVSPSNEVINATTYGSSSYSITYESQMENNTFMEWFTFDDGEEGNWTVRVRAPANLPQPENYEVLLFVPKDVSLALTTDKDIYRPSENVLIVAEVFNGTQPMLQSTVTAIVEQPDSSIRQFILFDDGQHNDQQTNDGIYGNNFTQTAGEGIYSLRVNASRGDTFDLQQSKTVFVETFPDLDVTDNDIQITPGQLIFGQNQTATVRATIRNIGEKDVINGLVQFYDGDPSEGGIFFGNATVALAVNASTSVSATLQHTVSLEPTFIIEGMPSLGQQLNLTLTEKDFKNHDVYVVVNSYTSLESNYTNNRAHRTIGYGSKPYILAISLGDTPGIPLGNGRSIPLNYDGIFEASLYYPTALGLSNSQGVFDTEGQTTVTWTVPNLPFLVGLPFYVGFVTLDTTQPFPGLIHSISPSQQIVIQP